MANLGGIERVTDAPMTLNSPSSTVSLAVCRAFPFLSRFFDLSFSSFFNFLDIDSGTPSDCSGYFRFLDEDDEEAACRGIMCEG